jgi:lipoprotein Spr
MLKQSLLYSLLFIMLASCSAIKTAFRGTDQQATNGSAPQVKKETKFLEQISVQVETSNPPRESEKLTDKPKQSIPVYSPVIASDEPETENLSALQLKYGVLLNTPAEEVKNTRMFEFIDEWYGTPYKLGGTTKKGIDCSAFSQYLFAAVYGISLPRTAREQHKLTNRISRTELKEGDLIFFNTRGGVSHVGVYLQNNKFVHASTSGGVMISDIFDEYWVRRFIGVGRLKEKEVMAANGR